MTISREEQGVRRAHQVVPMLHQQDQVLQLDWARVHEVPPQLCEAGPVLAVLAAAVQKGRVDLGVGFGAGAELPCGCLQDAELAFLIEDRSFSQPSHSPAFNSLTLIM